MMEQNHSFILVVVVKVDNIAMVPKTNLNSVGGTLNTDDHSYPLGYLPGNAHS